MVTFRQLEICLGSLWRRKVELKEENSKGFGLQSLRGTLPQGPRLLRSGAQCLRYVHKALANTFFARKALGQSMREKSSSLTWESSPSSHAQGWEEDQGDSTCRELMPLLEQLHLQVTAYNTRHQEEESLVLEGHHTYLVCSWSPTGQEKVYSTRLDGHQVLQDQPLIEHKELDGRFQFKFTHPLAGPPSFSAQP
ncbi:unnamed protein product [Microthlaspi erraticum]|uniref:Uncharacterized protein n=1 Tax=Microthlaspi erraticum TaxID=1685480 RepID=A0A6D2LD06_9BRAS|nr:unnamed protein product [Microthlaspi erraticum]